MVVVHGIHVFSSGMAFGDTFMILIVYSLYRSLLQFGIGMALLFCVFDYQAMTTKDNAYKYILHD